MLICYQADVFLSFYQLMMISIQIFQDFGTTYELLGYYLGTTAELNVDYLGATWYYVSAPV